MALIDKASLLMVPSTYEAGKLYNVLPSGNRAPDNKGGAGYDQTRADFDFDRGSNAAATRINSSGLIEKYRENVLLQSNNFGTTWTTSETLTSGQSGYNGTNNAWKLTAANSFPNVNQSLSKSGVQTFSVYAKAGDVNHLRILVVTGNNPDFRFDLSNGTISSEAGSDKIKGSITSVGNGWFRCEVAFNGSGTSYRFYPMADASTFAPIGDGLFIQNAQLESSLVATDYLNSTSVTAKAGVLIDLPRINYDANGENGALLLEPSRLNAIQFSEYFGTWTIAQMSIENNFSTSPEGIKNATRLIENTAGGTAHSVNLSTQTTQTEHAFSVYAKPNGRNYIYMYVGGGPGQGTIIDIVNGTKGNNVGNAPNDTIIEPVGNGWFRCTILFNGIAGTPTPSIGLAHTSSSFTYTGDGTSGVLIYAAQCEAGSHSSSYIPNHGTSGGVTRAADSCSVTGASDVIGQTEGTIYANVGTIVSGSLGADFCSIDDGTGSNRIHMFYNTSSKFGLYSEAGGSTQWLFTSNNTSTGNDKLAIAYKSNDAVFYINGVQVGTTSSFVVPSTTTYRIADRFDEAVKAQVFESKQTALFNERLTNAELATLTTL